MRIVLTGGGTGGHLIPLIAVAKKIKQRVPETELIFIGSRGKLENDLMGKEGIPTVGIATGKMRRYFSVLNFLDFFRVIGGIFQCLYLLVKYMPDAIFSKGGYASAPVVLVGWLYRIPVLVHESDSIPGVTNRMLGKFAKRVAVSYPEAEKFFPATQVVLTGNPLREDSAAGDAAKAKSQFALSEFKKTIFVFGGSQGSQLINEKIIRILPKLLQNYQVIHQTGENNLKNVEDKAGVLGIKAGRGGYYPLGFIGEDLKDIFAAADLVISRAGANSIAEIAANKKPSILIPLKNSANDHQAMNAYSLAKIGACVVLEETNLGENILMAKIEEIMNNPELQKKLSENIQVFYHADAADTIAEGILNMLK